MEGRGSLVTSEVEGLGSVAGDGLSRVLTRVANDNRDSAADNVGEYGGELSLMGTPPVVVLPT